MKLLLMLKIKYFQILSQDGERALLLKMILYTSIPVFGAMATLIQLFSYLLFFRYIFHHDNHIAVRVIKQTTLRQRNRFLLFIEMSEDLIS
jgi:hypothetical protein